jgi:iron-sulfur cluster assembly accessory protein
MIVITPKATEELGKLLASRALSPESGLRLAVRRGGCAGWQYEMKVAEPEPGDEVVVSGAARVIVAADSMDRLRGCEMDFSDDLTDAGFKIQNPKAARSCGCGTSFEELGDAPLEAAVKDGEACTPPKFWAPVPRDVEELPTKRPSFFWWLLANVLALCFAVISWFVCLHLFGNPELPRNYRILEKLGRLPVLKRYTLQDVPHGSVLAPKELYQRYFDHSEGHLRHVNSLLMRNYLQNFEESSLLTYIEGDFQLMKVRKLVAGDFFDPGIAIQAQAWVKPDDFSKPTPYPVFIEYLFPTEQQEMVRAFKVGDTLQVRKKTDGAAVLHVAKWTHEGAPALLLTVVPIFYGTYHLGSVGALRIEPPTKLRMGEVFPLFKDWACQMIRSEKNPATVSTRMPN